mmetsp:Transcript_10046/g.26924  ORF Transcript_10046/g.26924 Transcript_10046/m.26924 type:complete len:521 (+) Transcript_10046:636-2198(+)
MCANMVSSTSSPYLASRFAALASSASGNRAARLRRILPSFVSGGPLVDLLATSKLQNGRHISSNRARRGCDTYMSDTAASSSASSSMLGGPSIAAWPAGLTLAQSAHDISVDSTTMGICPSPAFDTFLPRQKWFTAEVGASSEMSYGETIVAKTGFSSEKRFSMLLWLSMSLLLGIGLKMGWLWYQATTQRPSSSIASLIATSDSGSISQDVPVSLMDFAGNARATISSLFSSSHMPPRYPITSFVQQCACASIVRSARGEMRTVYGAFLPMLANVRGRVKSRLSDVMFSYPLRPAFSRFGRFFAYSVGSTGSGGAVCFSGAFRFFSLVGLTGAGAGAGAGAAAAAAAAASDVPSPGLASPPESTPASPSVSCVSGLNPYARAAALLGSSGFPLSVYPSPLSATLAGSGFPCRHSLMKCFCAWLVNALLSLVCMCSAHLCQSRPYMSSASRNFFSSSSVHALGFCLICPPASFLFFRPDAVLSTPSSSTILGVDLAGARRPDEEPALPFFFFDFFRERPE